MAFIILTQGFEAEVDDENLAILNKYKWHVKKCKNKHYAEAYLGANKNIYMHRLLLNLTNSLIFADHIDGDGLNNKKSNLRVSTNTQNSRNQKHKSGGTSTYKGVHWDKARTKWMVRIRIDNNKRLTKRFVDEIDAAKWYDQQALLHHGEFSHLNFNN